MNDPTHAPGWRGRPVRHGPIEGQNERPAWLLMLEAFAPAGCMIVAAITLAIAAYAWSTDFLAGHL
jgi:hypothetical protein